MTQQKNFFLGSATIDLTHSDMDIFFQWRIDNFVMVLFTPTGPQPLPDPTAFSVVFVSASPTGVPAGLAATNVVLSSLLPLTE